MKRDRDERHLESRYVMVGGRRTSVRLESEIWLALDEICARENATLHRLCGAIDAQRGPSGRSSVMRVLAIGYFREAATDDGHQRAGHGPMPDPLEAGKGDTARPRSLLAAIRADLARHPKSRVTRDRG
jgi:predicted DNA-binding ribbon-helix-helix protein